MPKHVSDFIDFLRGCGLAPAKTSDIIADDKRRTYQLDIDPPKKKAASYQLKVDQMGAVGWAHCFRSGETFKYSSRAKKEWTVEERKAWKDKVRAERKAKEQAEAKERDDGAKRAAALWKQAKPASLDHPYIKRKGIQPHNIRETNGQLIVAMYKQGRLVNAQTIDEEGDKLFQRGAEIQGAFYPIAHKDDDKSVMLICEGFATGASLREATEMPVIVAFNAGNLKPVAQAIRKKYPDSKIIICADNDQWTFAKGKNPEGIKRHDIKGDDPRWQQWADQELLWNPGIEKGKAAAAAVGGFMTYPQVPQLDAKKRTDFNDIRDLGVIKETIDTVLAASAMDVVRGGEGAISLAVDNDSPPSYELPPLAAYEYEFKKPVDEEPDFDWQAQIITDSKGNPQKASLKNAMLFLRYQDNYKGVFRYNEFDHKITICQCPPWESENRFKVHTLNDVDISECAAYLENYGLSPDRTRVHNAIQVVADRNRFHPVRAYFDKLEWDGVLRLEKWLSYYLGAEQEPFEYLAFIGKKWLTAAVKRIYEPGCKFDHILVIEGAQGKGKSTALRELATFGDDMQVQYFTDGVNIAAIQDKDTVDILQGSLIVELAELAGFSKRDDEEIKRWVTLQSDKVRLPYERTSKVFDRQFVLAATTNSYDYLKDPSGNRRYWPFVAGNIDIESIQMDRKQLWAEAVHCYKDGLYIGPTEKEQKLAAIQQEKRRLSDTWEQDVEDAIFNMGVNYRNGGFTTKDIMKEMGLSLKDQDQRSQRRISSILQGLEFESVVERKNKKNKRIWKKSLDPEIE